MSLIEFACYHYKDELDNQVIKEIAKHIPKNRTIAVACMGTDKVIGDAVGPLVGTFLRASRVPNVTGSLDSPLDGHIKNCQEEVCRRLGLENPFIIAVDSCRSATERIGYIQVAKGAIHPGNAVRSDTFPIGEIAIIGTTSAIEDGIWGDIATRLQLTMIMALSMYNIIIKVLKEAGRV